MKIPLNIVSRRPGSWRQRLIALLLTACMPSAVAVAQAQAPQGPPARIAAQISNTLQVTLAGSLHPLAQSRFESGRLPSSTKLDSMVLHFSRSAQQEADLKALIKAQQDPSSPLYHKWLTPDAFAARFGMAQSDLDAATQWIEQQGFRVERIARSHNAIYFSGTAGQAETAFSTQLHYYTVEGEKHFAPSTALSIPRAFAGVVSYVGNLDDFRPKPMLHTVPRSQVRAQFTSGQTGNHFVSPGDAATIYDVNPLYSAGTNGNGQSIAIVGQSYIFMSDIENFQTASGWSTPKDPAMVLVPGTGSDGVAYAGDEAESDLDLEWSSTMAPGATIYFVYTGGGTAGVFDSLAYAVDTRIAPIISVSYGGCEMAFPSDEVSSIESVNEQGVAQGQSILVASGDDGASGCFRDTNLSNQDRVSLAVSYPASSAYVTAVGGTEFNEGSGTYWADTPSTDIISSALSYIPEKVWNEDDPVNGLGASGGGVSTLFSKPAWQAGVPGIPTDGVRDVPDIALASAGGHDGLLFCSSDTSFWPQGQQASCNSGFRDAATGVVTEAGGTSFATPIFAGMLALLNEQQNSTGQGLINPTLYTLASNATTYGTAFHDITVGDNKCDTGETTTFCLNGPTGYSAGTGYDLTTGLGSIDFNNLVQAWGTTTSLAGSNTALTLKTAVPSVSAPVSIGIAVTAASGSGVPTGSVSMTVDGTADPNPVQLANGAATYSATIATGGNHIVVATYSGDNNFAASTSTLSFNTLPGTTVSIASSIANPAVNQKDTFTFDVEPQAGLDRPTGTIDISVDGAIVAAAVPLASGQASYTTSFSTMGQHTVTGAYSGSNSFSASSSTLTVNVVTSTTLTVTPATLTPAIGIADAFTVKVAPASGSALPSGTLRVVIDGSTLTPAPVLTNGAASFTATFATVGAHTVTTSYAGDSTFGASSSQLTVTAAAAPVATTTTVTPSSSTPSVGATESFTISVTPATGSTAPDGTVSLTVDGTVVPNSLTLTGGTATYSTSFSTAGAHTVSAAYSGSAAFAASSGSATVTVPAPTFTLSGGAVTVKQGDTATESITLTPANGYTGSVAFSVTGNSTLSDTCFSLPEATVTGSSAVTTTLTVSTNQASCTTAQSVTGVARVNTPRPITPIGKTGTGLMILAGVIIGFIGRHSRKLRLFATVLLLASAGLLATGCGSSSKTETPKGTYNLTITGTDTAKSAVTSSTTITLTVN